MSKHTWAGRVLRVLLVGIMILPFIGYFAPAASAHHPILSVDGSCVAESGEWTITWTVANGNWSSRNMTVDQVTYPDGQLADIKVGLFLGPNATESDAVHYPLSDTGVKTLIVRADWDGGGPQNVTKSLSIDLSTLDDTGCRVPTDVSVSVTPGSCSWDGESSETPVTVVIDPVSGASVTITGPGGPYVATGSGDVFTLDPGSYAWTAAAAEGFVLTGPASGEFTAGECPPPPTDVLVSVTPGSCHWTGESSETPVTVMVDPELGATVRITGPGGPYDFTNDATAYLLPGTYGWSAEAAEGFVLSGATSGEFTVDACPPPPPTTTQPPALGSIGDFVWNDGPITEANGIQDAGEAGVGSVPVNLYSGSGALIASTMTDAAGHYMFANLPAGTYVVEFMAPEAFGFTAANEAGPDPTDSDANRGSGRTGPITLAAGQDDMSWDAGLVSAQVAPTTVTRPPETLPFTGASGTGGKGGAAIALILAGGLVLLMARKETASRSDNN